MTAKNGKPVTREADLLKEHAELVAQYPVTTGATKAQVVRKLNLVQVELDLLNVEYPYWVKPEPIATRTYLLAPDELLDRIEGLRKLVAREDRPEAARATADRELTNALQQAEKRGLTVPSAS
jgi:hypothetical protein